MDPSFTIGIEEEYLLVNLETRDLVVEAPDSLMSECERRLEGRVSPEFMQSQIEVGTSKHANVKGAAEELAFLRKTVAEVAGRHGLAPIAASTHPFAEWDHQKHTRKDRYDALARDMQAVVRRLLICGMHVHVGLDDDDLRIDLMQQIAYFLPHLLVLSTSSPFWRGENTGPSNRPEGSLVAIFDCWLDIHPDDTQTHVVGPEKDFSTSDVVPECGDLPLPRRGYSGQSRPCSLRGTSDALSPTRRTAHTPQHPVGCPSGP